MKESLLHYIWEGLHFNLTDLKTICGKSIFLCSRGIYNRDQGPDFSHGHIQIDGTDHFGNIELHVKSKEWYQHRHETDEKYNSVILHVVYESDGKPVFRKDGTVIPEIELKNRINPVTLKNYDALNLAESKIACGGMIGYLPTEDVREEFSRMGMMRIGRKAALFLQDLQKNKMDWEQTLWEHIAARMGGKVNKDALQHLASLACWKMLSRYRGNRFAIETLLFGLAGFITRDMKDYSWWDEWEYLSGKHKLGAMHLNLKKLRMRPSSFPELRISQLADIVMQVHDLTKMLMPEGIKRFSRFKAAASEPAMKTFSSRKIKHSQVGSDLMQSVVINALLPAHAAWKIYSGKDASKFIKAWLSNQPAENNKIVRNFDDLGAKAGHALHSQGMAETYLSFCTKRNCLTCGIGRKLLSR